jgi:outer membrane immunogenic protein
LPIGYIHRGCRHLSWIRLFDLGAVLKKLLLGAAALVVLAGPSFAADLPVKAVAPPVPVLDWTGFYIGGNVGGGFASSTLTGFSGSPASAPLFAAGQFPNVLAPGAGGLIGGGQIGYNWQVSRSWLIGLETDYQYSGYKGSASVPTAIPGLAPFTTSVEQHSDWFGTFRGRVGVLATPSVLLYGTGGLAYGQTEASFSTIGTGFTLATCPTALPCAAGSTSSTHVGWTLGGGFEIMSIPHWTFKVEYLYVDLGTQTPTGTTSPAFTGIPISFSASTPFKENILRAGVNYKF